MVERSCCRRQHRAQHRGRRGDRVGRDLPANVVAVGNPARIIRQLCPEGRYITVPSAPPTSRRPPDSFDDCRHRSTSPDAAACRSVVPSHRHHAQASASCKHGAEGSVLRQLVSHRWSAPEGSDRIAVDLGKQVADAPRGPDAVVGVEVQVVATPVQRPRSSGLGVSKPRYGASGSIQTRGAPARGRAARQPSGAEAATSQSTRTWWRARSGTRAAHQRCRRATSSSGNPAVDMQPGCYLHPRPVRPVQRSAGRKGGHAVHGRATHRARATDMADVAIVLADPRVATDG